VSPIYTSADMLSSDGFVRLYPFFLECHFLINLENKNIEIRQLGLVLLLCECDREVLLVSSLCKNKMHMLAIS
jgi:hypothetical protein